MRKILLLLLMLLPMIAGAHDFEIDGIYYSIKGNEATVTFRGDDEDEYSNEYSGDIVIPEIVTYNGVAYSVTSIARDAFWKCGSLTSVTIPKSVTFIDIEIFCFCNALERIIVDSGNTKYDSRNNCNAIIETETNTLIEGCIGTVIPNSVTSLGRESFVYRETLTDINIPNSVNTINEGVFYGCYALKNVKMGNSVSSIGYHAFCYCSMMTEIVLPNSLKTIGFEAFYGCYGLTKVTIPNSVTNIGGYAFYTYDYHNIDVTLCGNIDTVGNNIFHGVSTLTISSEVSKIPNFNFSPYQIYCYATTPPSCQEGTFSSYYAQLHVPASSFSAYFIAPTWENFNSVIGDAVEPQSISMNQTNLVLSRGEQMTLTATVNPTNAYPNSILWTSSNPIVATVSNGIVSALGIGECDIIAYCMDKQAICHVVVKDTSIILELDQYEGRVLPNHMMTITVTSSSDLIPDLSVTSSDPSVAAARLVNNKIQVVGIKEGTTTITVGSVDGTAIPATCLVTVYTEPGDMNCDGFLNISDVTSLIDYLLSGENSQISTKNADVNGDENINISDVTTLIDILLSGNG